MDYEKAYAVLFNAITSAINALEKSKTTIPEASVAVAILQKAQLETEDMYISDK